jgi:hypothetical protein
VTFPLRVILALIVIAAVASVCVWALIEGPVVSPVVWKFGWRILPVGEVHDQPAALAGGHRRSASWARLSASRSQGMNLSRSR